MVGEDLEQVLDFALVHADACVLNLGLQESLAVEFIEPDYDFDGASRLVELYRVDDYVKEDLAVELLLHAELHRQVAFQVHLKLDAAFIHLYPKGL